MMKHTYLKWLSVAFLLLLSSCNNLSTNSKKSVKEKFRFAFFTDVHLNKGNYNKGNEGLRMALRDAKSKKVDFVLFGGDNADCDGLGDDEVAADNLQERFKCIVSEMGIPAYFTIGNHDRFYKNGLKIDTLGFHVFEKHFGATYQSFTHKGVHFVTLNSLYPSPKGGYFVNKKQLDWLKSDLDKIEKDMPVIVSLHVPMLSLYYPVVEGNFKGYDMIVNTKEVYEVLNGYNIKIVLQGHQHIYEQIQERNSWFITGGGVSAHWWGGSFLETEEGYLLVTVDTNNNFTWEYVDYGWEAKR